MAKTTNPKTVHIKLDDETHKSIKVISDLLKAWGQNASISSALRFAAIRTARNITDPA